MSPRADSTTRPDGKAAPITKGDLEAKFRELAGTTEAGVEHAKGTALRVGIAVGVVVLVSAYLLGRRRGRRTRTFVEIRRI
ncbi:MAG: hypothetical protein U0V73_09955 [Acidimicrobiia bacterium]